MNAIMFFLYLNGSIAIIAFAVFVFTLDLHWAVIFVANAFATWLNVRALADERTGR